MKKLFLFLAGLLVFATSGCAPNVDVEAEPDDRAGESSGFVSVNDTQLLYSALLEEDFSGLEVGMFSTAVGAVGAFTEYHYHPQAAPRGNWAVSSFTWEEGSQRAWRVEQDGHARVMVQTFDNKELNHTHPMLIAGDDLWTDYTVSVTFAPESRRDQSGLVFRYRNDRCYYFFGLEGPKFFGWQKSRVVLKVVRHGTGFREPYEKILAQKEFLWSPFKYYTAKVTVNGSHIRAQIGKDTVLEADDETYALGKVGLTADVPTRYSHVKVMTTEVEKKRIEALREERERELADLQAANPRPVVWKKIKTKGFGVGGIGRNLRFGDLNGDGQIDVLIGQVVPHAWPSDSGRELTCLTAMTFDGEILWQIGTPDLEKKPLLAGDVPFQIHDLDGDGRNEVIYAMKSYLIVADGATGKTKYKAPTPTSKPPGDRYLRILGDSLHFLDLRGTGHPRDILIKDGYWHLWALNDRLEILWEAACKTGHYPYSFDIDGDGRDEFVIGYSLFDEHGRKLWSLDDSFEEHTDAVAVVNFQEKQGSQPRVLFAASDEGVFYTDLQGKVLRRHFVGHTQNLAVADFRPDLPGLEALSINFWGNQGIIHFYDSSGHIYHDFEPIQHGSILLPTNWTGRPGEYFVLSANAVEGGIFDGWGRRVVLFPDDGHPDMTYAVLDITGDCRDEVVVWDSHEIWVYTQDDNPKSGTLYKPVRNPLYNYSNYQATVSLPGWNNE